MEAVEVKRGGAFFTQRMRYAYLGKKNREKLYPEVEWKP